MSDSGAGVPADLRVAIFHHGFSTKAGGHGFGLHLSALSAKSLGGTLRLANGGPLSGATFVLEVPAEAVVPYGLHLPSVH